MARFGAMVKNSQKTDKPYSLTRALFGKGVKEQGARLERLTREVVDRTLRQLVWENGRGEATLESGLEGVVQGTRTPYQLAQEVVADIRKEHRA